MDKINLGNSSRGKKTSASFLIGIGLAFLLLLPSMTGINVEEAPEFGGNCLGRSIVHPIISLNGNTALAGFANNTGGNGSSWANAVIIENLEITAGTNERCIEIENTNIYLIIRDCTLTGAVSTYDAGIYLGNCTNVNVTGNVATGNYFGIFLDSSDDNMISGNNATVNSRHGIYLEGSDDNTISGNSATGNTYSGIGLVGGFGNTISGNDAMDNDGGIDVDQSDDNTVSGNHVTGNLWAGIAIGMASGNTVSGNDVRDNGGGIYLGDAIDTIVSGNCISGNTDNGDDTSGVNTSWDDGRNGNYWGDYETAYPGASNDGVNWNTSYTLNGVQDDYPLVTPFVLDVDPVAGFNATDTPIIEGDWVNFWFTGSPGNGIAYQWDFGDGGPNSTGKDPVRQYNTAGNFEVTLTVTDIDGDSSTISWVIQVGEDGDTQPSGIDSRDILLASIGAIAGVSLLGNVLLFLKNRKPKGRSPDDATKKGKPSN
ncbi:MAG: NosD domain-containing protein [Candidatus Hodarchaeota archaeon]